MVTDSEAEGGVPYIMAFTREVLRYFTALRLALPRSNESDVRYNEILIPRGSTIFLNAWACNMDPDAFDEPHTFCPERFLSKPDLPIFTYGLGGRMCVGYILGNRQLYILFLRLISTFRIIPDPQANITSCDPVKGVFDSKTLVSQPERFRCHFIPRNDKIKDWLSGDIEVRGGVEQ
jgi:3-hydroxyphenylacetate 6-hydroxylase